MTQIALVHPTRSSADANLFSDTVDNDNAIIAVVNSQLQNENLAANAQVAHAKLANSTAANLLIANGSGVITGTAVTGDVTISASGVTAIGATKVTNAMLAGSITDAKLASANNSTYRTLLTGTGNYPATTAGTQLFCVDGTTTTSAVAVSLNLFYFASADYTVGSLTQKLRLRAQQKTIGTGPGTTLTVGMYPVTAPSGSSVTLGTVVSGSIASFVSTAANTFDQKNSGDFTIPSDGYYVIGIANSGTTAGASGHDLYFQLQSRNV